MLQDFHIVPLDEIGTFRIYMGSQKLEHVTAVHVDLEVNCIPKIQLEFAARSVDMVLPKAEVNIENE